MSQNPYKKYWSSLKFLALIGLVIWAYDQGLLHDAFNVLKKLDASSAGLAFTALGITLFLGVIRWRWLLRFLELPEPSFKQGLQLYYEGLFYNTFAPGAIGGDLLRAHWLRQSGETHSKLHYFVTLGERALGLGTLGILGVWAWFGLQFMLFYLAISCLFIALCPKLCRLLNSKWALPLPQFPKIRWLYLATALNTLSHLVSYLVYILIGQALGVELELLTWLEILSLTVLAANLPLSVAGIGPREFALVSLLSQHGVAHEIAIAISMGALAMLMIHSLAGGVIHLFGSSKGQPPKPLVE